MTIEEKLEQPCPEFNRMHDMLDERSNIQPASTLEPGLPFQVPDGRHSIRCTDVSEKPARTSVGVVFKRNRVAAIVPSRNLAMTVMAVRTRSLMSASRYCGQRSAGLSR